MGWYSILPSHLNIYETWVIRIFLILAVINISPWIIAILYDLILYIARRLWHEIPVVGGRARGEVRPRAPSLRDRAQRLSFVNIVTGGGGGSGSESPGRTALQDDRTELRRRMHERSLSSKSVIEEVDGDGSFTGQR